MSAEVKIPRQNTTWLHRATNERHTVIGHIIEAEPEVVTWGAKRLSWLGTPDDFNQEFEPMPPQQERLYVGD